MFIRQINSEGGWIDGIKQDLTGHVIRAAAEEKDRASVRGAHMRGEGRGEGRGEAEERQKERKTREPGRRKEKRLVEYKETQGWNGCLELVGENCSRCLT